METSFGSASRHFYGTQMNLRAMGKRAVEWDLNDWKWDGDLFIATQTNPSPSNRQFFPLGSGAPVTGNSSNSSSSCSDEVNLRIENGGRELEKRQRDVVDEDDEVGGLNLMLGGGGHLVSEKDVRNWEGNGGKKTKLVGTSINRAVCCQVDNCGADLRNAKDYHRRHKVCEMHSKATKALVGSAMQRFCQQCSRFHVLQEFDEGKRSCRRRLAGHNKRRRKRNPDNAASSSSLNDDQANGYLLITLLKILSNMHSNRSEQSNNQDLLSHLLQSLASNNSTHGGRNLSGLLQASQGLLKDGTSMGNSEMVSALLSNGPQGSPRVPASELPQKASLSVNGNPSQNGIVFPVKDGPPTYSDARGITEHTIKGNNFDLNDIYIDSDDGTEDIERSPPVPASLGTGSPECPSWLQQLSQQSSPPQTSRNSDSASAQSPSSSSGEAQSRTDRIVFKLFGKEPNDFPPVLRAQIFDWLSHSPTDIESYIRPGCIVLTIYLRLDESVWEELCSDLSSSLSRLLDVSEDCFWKTGWVYVRVQQQIAFVYNGQVIVNTPLPRRSYTCSRILSVTPIAVPVSERTHFSVKGYNLSRPTTRLLCALDGKYLLPENDNESVETVDSVKEHELQSVNFSCSLPMVTVRGFFEVEDIGLTSNFFPFIVVEKDICSEIRMLETAIDLTETDCVGETEKLDARNEALDFVHEMGWLLHRSQRRTRLSDLDASTDLFSFERFRWLTEFAMDRDWCAVVKKLLDILLVGTVGLGEHPNIILAVSELGLLHRAVRRNSTPLVKLLLRYVPEKVSDVLDPEWNENGGQKRLLFTPDAVGPAGVTPLHIAAGKDGSENVLDALTDDPGMVGIEAWKSAHDSTGSTPEDYARLRGHYSYIHLVQRKINKRSAPQHVVLDIPNIIPKYNIDPKQSHELNSTLHIEQFRLQSAKGSCQMCEKKMVRRIAGRSLLYRPAMLSMVAIAAVCVCVALLFKSSPEVLHAFPFRWESLDFGSS